MTIDKIQFTYSAYVTWLKIYSLRVTSFVQNSDGFREAAIGELLRLHCSEQNPAAFTTMEELGFETFTEGCWTMAGELILNNEKIDV